MFSIDLSNNGTANNLGKPVNSEKDDFAFTFNKKNKLGYVSSNRDGRDQIYGAIPVVPNGIINAIVTNADTDAPLSNARITISANDSNILDKQLTTDKGLVTYSAKNDLTYLVEVNKDGFVSQSFPVTVINGDTFKVVAKLEPVDVVVTETEIILKDIYFENNRSGITKQAAEELDKLVYVLSQNKDLVIFVKSHTDIRGKDDYNMDLSERRANATVAYIISKGINENQISGKGFGESELKVNCNPKCTEEEHALNRRSEFLIVKK